MAIEIIISVQYSEACEQRPPLGHKSSLQRDCRPKLIAKELLGPNQVVSMDVVSVQRSKTIAKWDPTKWSL